MKLTFIELLSNLNQVILPAKISIPRRKQEKELIFANLLLLSTENRNGKGVIVNRNPNNLDLKDGDCVYIKINTNQAISFLLTGESFGVCGVLEKIEDETKFDEVVQSIKFLNENLGYKQILNREIISAELFEDLKQSFSKVKDILGLDETEFNEIFEAKRIINELNKANEQIGKDKEALERIKTEIQSNTKIRDTLNTEIDNLGNIRDENKWIENIKAYFYVEQENIDINEPLNEPSNFFAEIVNSLEKRFNISEKFIHCYLLSLFTSLIQGRFLLLTGHIGTGKSKIIKETGKLLGGETNMVAVRPAWLDASDLLGYFDPINQRYHTTDFVSFIMKKNNNRINMILLDELNIARIENYGADILATLSSIDSRDDEENKIRLFSADLQEMICTYRMYNALSEEHQSTFKSTLTWFEQQAQVAIPKNVLICGTLNIDGSTENLSPKMIDRSFMLKFPDFDGLLKNTEEIQDKVDIPIEALVVELEKQPKVDVETWNTFFQQYINSIKDYLVPISNRVAKDYLMYYQLANFFGISNQEEIHTGFFYARILPRLRIEKTNKKSIGTVVEVLNKFESNLFDGFKNSLENVGEGDFIDYQHICG